jgi:hypothetical protein
MSNYRRSGWITTRTGKRHFLDGAVSTLDADFDVPEETSIQEHFKTRCWIGMDPYDSRPVFEPTKTDK